MDLASRTALARLLFVGLIGLALPIKQLIERLPAQASKVEPESRPSLGGSSDERRSLNLPLEKAPNLSKHARLFETDFDLSRQELSVPTSAQSKANHSPSIAALSNGHLAMAWFGGSREGARDVRIFFARFDGLVWSSAQPIMGTDQLIKESGRYVTKLGNPMIYFDGERLHCWFVSVSFGGWGGARINHMASIDHGATWSSPKLLIASPFLNVSTLVRSTALPASDDSIIVQPSAGASSVSRETLIPAYFELTHKYPVMLRVDSKSQILDRYPFGGLTGLLQPSVVRVTSPPKPSPSQGNEGALGQRQQPSNQPDPLYAYFRRGLAMAQTKVFFSSSMDDGKTWSTARATTIPNGDASVLAWASLSHIWLIANPSLTHRRSIASFQLPIIQTTEESARGDNLSPTLILDQVPESLQGHQEFSYPSFAQTLDRRLHLVYTADGRKTVRHRIWSPVQSSFAGPPQSPAPNRREPIGEQSAPKKPRKEQSTNEQAPKEQSTKKQTTKEGSNREQPSSSAQPKSAQP